MQKEYDASCSLSNYKAYLTIWGYFLQMEGNLYVEDLPAVAYINLNLFHSLDFSHSPFQSKYKKKHVQAEIQVCSLLPLVQNYRFFICNLQVFWFSVIEELMKNFDSSLRVLDMYSSPFFTASVTLICICLCFYEEQGVIHSKRFGCQEFQQEKIFYQ